MEKPRINLIINYFIDSIKGVEHTILQTFLPMIIVGALLTSCGGSSGGGGGTGDGDNDETPQTVSSIKITSSDKMLYQAKRQMTAIATYSDDTTADISESVSWTSEDSTIVSLDTDGMGTASGIGSTSVSASFSNVALDNITITVEKPLLIGHSQEDGGLYHIDPSDGSATLILEVFDSSADSVTIDPIDFRSLAYDSNTETLYAGTGGGADCATCIFTIDLTNGEATLFIDLQDNSGIDATKGISGMDIDENGDLYFIAWGTSTSHHELYSVSTDGTSDAREVMELDTAIGMILTCGNSISFDRSGDLYWTSYDNGLVKLDTSDQTADSVGSFSGDWLDADDCPQGLAISPWDEKAIMVDTGEEKIYSVDLATAATTLIADNSMGINGVTYMYGSRNSSPAINVQTEHFSFQNGDWSVTPDFWDDVDDELSIKYTLTDSSCSSLCYDNEVLATDLETVFLTTDTKGICNLEITATDSEGGTVSKSVSINAGPWDAISNESLNRYGRASATLNGKIYLMGGKGSDNQVSNVVQEFDPMTDTWTTKANMPTAVQYAAAAVVDGKIYVIGGETANFNTSVSVVQEYDPASDSWTTKQSMPTSRYRLSAGVVNGKIYAMGGRQNNDTLDVVQEYDPVSNSWTTKAAMPEGRVSFGISEVNGKLYTIGGTRIARSSVEWHSDVEEYDPISDSWSTKTDMPTARNNLITGVVDGKIYAIGGKFEGSYGGTTTIVEEYDPVSDSWISKTNYTLNLLVDPATGIYDGKIYLIGIVPEDTVVYDPAFD